MAHKATHAEHGRLHCRHAMEHHGKHADAVLGILSSSSRDGCKAMWESHKPGKGDPWNIPQVLQTDQIHTPYQSAIHKQGPHVRRRLWEDGSSFDHLTARPSTPPARTRVTANRLCQDPSELALWQKSLRTVGG